MSFIGLKYYRLFLIINYDSESCCIDYLYHTLYMSMSDSNSMLISVDISSDETLNQNPWRFSRNDSMNFPLVLIQCNFHYSILSCMGKVDTISKRHFGSFCFVLFSFFFQICIIEYLTVLLSSFVLFLNRSKMITVISMHTQVIITCKERGTVGYIIG